MKPPIYLDNHATTPVDPKVLEAMLPYFKGNFGNAGSKQHAYGWVAEEAVEQAREQVAGLIGAKSKEIVFTSGATESNNLALFGIAEAYQDKGKHLITVATEHKAILDPMAALEKLGFDVTYLKVDQYGLIDLDALRNAITDETVLVSVMWANNEIGTIQPMQGIAEIVHAKNCLLHTDAAQAAGKISVNVDDVDLISLSAHKVYGPKGIGALYVRSRDPHVRVAPQMIGGGQERGMRSGTLAVPLIVGMGKAFQVAQEQLTVESVRMGALRDKLYEGIKKQLDDVHLNGHPEQRLPNNLNLSFEGIKAEALMIAMDSVAVSSGSACTTADPKPSHVLRALGIGEKLSHGAIRFGLGRFNTEAEIDTAIDQVVATVNRLRKV